MLCRRSTALWRRGTGQERTALAAGSVPVARYASLVREKLGWIAVPSQALLLVDGDSDRLESFLAAYDLFLLGLQAIDDVSDRDQDRALHGCDVPTALGCSPGALLRTAPKLVQRAAAAATGGGFAWLAAWLEAFSRAIGSWSLGGDVAGGRAGRDRDRGSRSKRRSSVAANPPASRRPLAASVPA